MYNNYTISFIFYLMIFLFATGFVIAGEEKRTDTGLSQTDVKYTNAILKQKALEAAFRYDESAAYIKNTKNTFFLKHEAFDTFDENSTFNSLREKYNLDFGPLPFFYLYSALIGFFIAFVLLFKKSGDIIATLLISVFLLLHSSFRFHIFLCVTNLKYEHPQILMMTVGFSFLYAPLIYFYFRRFTQSYQFRAIDLLHLIPTVIVFIVLIPIYNLPESEKLAIMFDVSDFNIKQYLPYLMFTKLISLIVYGSFLLKAYLKTRGNTLFTIVAQKWQRNLVFLGMFYIISYAIYGLTIIEILPRWVLLYYLQIVAMAMMVLYIGFVANLKPFVFDVFLNKVQSKYAKSGLTPGFSLELKDALVAIFEGQYIYRENNITLDKVAEKLGVSRHNASQVINEHFVLNFFELVNQYRIKEALSLLKEHEKSNIRIVNIAYLVGFNNKVTFNKSFKKIMSLTPSAYLKTLQVT
ncbi:MAG: AraC-like DNA-binding protein [Patiriisocius sp.]|jgi:AraC-like DNA-binding protein